MEGDEDRLAAEELLGADVYEEAREAHGWAPTTTKTLLRRLVEKRHLQVTPVGTSYLYRPARPAWQSLAGAADTLLDNTLEGMDGKLLAYMVKKSRLTPDDLAQLRSDPRRARARRRREWGGRAMNLVGTPQRLGSGLVRASWCGP